MKDAEALDFLAERVKPPANLAKTLGVSPQTLVNWRARGISAPKKPAVWALANDLGAGLSRDWLMQRTA